MRSSFVTGLDASLTQELRLLLLQFGDSPTRKPQRYLIVAERHADDGDYCRPEEGTLGGGSPRGKAEAAEVVRWGDVVCGIRPRIRRPLKRLSARIGEQHPRKWKYERVLGLLVLLTRLRKYDPGTAIP